MKQEYHHCHKKLVHVLFHFHVTPQALATQQTMSVIDRLRRSNSVDNTCGETTLTLRWQTAVV